jgi:hypothetical protein
VTPVRKGNPKVETALNWAVQEGTATHLLRMTSYKGERK